MSNKLNPPYTHTHTHTPQAVKKNKFIENLFSFKPSDDRKYKIISLLGLKFYINNKNHWCNILSYEETINKLLNERISLARFGDGEFGIMYYNTGVGFQKADINLGNRLKEVIISSSNKLLIALPRYLNYTRCSKSSCWKKVIDIAKPQLKEILPNVEYGNAHATRYPKFGIILKKLWTNKEIIIVEGDKTRSGIGNDLFDNAKSIQRILTPNEHAFDKYDTILEECKKQDKDKIFLLSVGPTATVLAYDLAMLGYHALDIGHLDLAYEWSLQNVAIHSKIEGKYTNEAQGGRENIAPCLDPIYLNSIIADLSN